MSYRINDRQHPLTEDLSPGKQLRLTGYSEARSNELHPTAFKPVFYAADTEATVLGAYHDGKAALAVRDFGAWKSIYSAVPYMDRALLRNVARWAGVHLYCELGPVVRARGPFLLIHKGHKGPEKIPVKLTSRAAVTDLFTSVELARATAELTLDSPRCGTFFLQLSPPR